MDAEDQNQDEILDFDGQEDGYGADDEQKGYGGEEYEAGEDNGDDASYEAMVGDDERNEHGTDALEDADDHILGGLEGIIHVQDVCGSRLSQQSKLVDTCLCSQLQVVMRTLRLHSQ